MNQGNKARFEVIHTSKGPTMFLVLFKDTAALLGLSVSVAVVRQIGILAVKKLLIMHIEGKYLSAHSKPWFRRYNRFSAS